MESSLYGLAIVLEKKSMLKRIFLVLACVLGAVSCGGESEGPQTVESASSSGSTVQGVTDTEILIGSANDLSGPTAIYGVQVVNAVRMRFDEANEAGGIHGRQLRLVVEDMGYQVPRAIQATNKLVNRDKIFAMMMAMGTPMNNANMPTLFDAGIPNLFPISGARSMVEPFAGLQVTGRGIYYDEIRAAARYFMDQGAQVPCIVYQDTDYGQEIYEGALDYLTENGMEPGAVSAHKPADSEFTSTILRLRNANCDLVLMGTIHRDTILILESARKMGWEGVQWVGTNASYNEAIANQESGSGEGYSVFAHMALPYRDDEMSEWMANWWDKYAGLYDTNLEYAAMEAYRNADIVVRALEAVGPDLTGEKLIAAIEAMGSFEDPFGYSLTFGPDDHKGVDESVLITVVDGRWQVQAEKIKY
jgi:branched-chain amino acid transport system substrate-binding protein